LTIEQNKALATTPVEELLKLEFLQPAHVKDSLHAYQLAKRGNSPRVMAEAVRWGKRGARVNTISPGIIITPLAKAELTGPRGEGYRRMIELSPAKRPGTPAACGSVMSSATVDRFAYAPTARSSRLPRPAALSPHGGGWR
jgi:NAD(P)-dependent dehydrogenase (short-subunit alcohol dehydrogenase family)